MRRALLAGIAALPLFLIHSTCADALIVECANCSDLATQVLQQAKQVQQYLTQLQQYQTQLLQYQNMIQNSLTLPQSIWANVSGDIMQVRALANAGSLLTGNSGSILTRLQSAGYYASSASMLPQNIGAQFSMYQMTMGNAGNSLARTLGVQQGQEQNYAALQARLQAQSQSASGQMQAIQAGNELAALTSTQLQQVQTTLTAAAQEQATRDVIAADRTAAEDAATLQFSQYRPVATTGSQGF